VSKWIHFVLSASLVLCVSLLSVAQAPVRQDTSAPLQTRQYPLLTGTSSAPQAISELSDAGNPLLLPTVTYSTGGHDQIFYGGAWMALADVNADGKPDLLVANGCTSVTSRDCSSGTVGVLIGNGDGTFQPVVTYGSGGLNPFYVSAADLNDDGKLDLLVLNSGSVGVLLGNGDGTFQPVKTFLTGGTSTWAAVADVNDDGKPDVVVANSNGGSDGQGSVGVLMGNGDGTLKPVVIYSSGGMATAFVAVADVNKDSKPDLLVVNTSDCQDCAGSVGVLLGNGDGSFQTEVSYSTGAYSSSLTVADVNGDGNLDLVIDNGGTFDGGGLAVLLGKGDGTFGAAVNYGTGGGYNNGPIVVTDVNGDHKPDLLMANGSCYGGSGGCIGVLLGNGDGSFQPSVTYACSGAAGCDALAVADINGDGYPDLVIANDIQTTGKHETGSVGTLLGNGDGTFQPVVLHDSGGFYGTQIFAADLNGDGKLDVLVADAREDTNAANNSGLIGVLLNNRQGPPYNPTTTTLVTSVNPANPKQKTVFNVTVANQGGGALTGIVTFQDGSTTLASVVLAGNQAAYSVGFKVSGPHAITASYSGDAINGFSAATLTQRVEAVSKTVLTTSGSPSIVGQPATFTATVTSRQGPVPDGGLVTFYDGTSILGSADLASEVATLTTSSLAAKNHTITAVYVESATFKSSTGRTRQLVEK
jgi:hypothetical protein